MVRRFKHARNGWQGLVELWYYPDGTRQALYADGTTEMISSYGQSEYHWKLNDAERFVAQGYWIELDLVIAEWDGVPLW